MHLQSLALHPGCGSGQINLVLFYHMCQSFPSLRAGRGGLPQGRERRVASGQEEEGLSLRLCVGSLPEGNTAASHMRDLV